MEAVISYVEEIANANFKDFKDGIKSVSLDRERHLTRQIAYASYPPSLPTEFCGQYISPHIFQENNPKFWSAVTAALKERNPNWSFEWAITQSTVSLVVSTVFFFLLLLSKDESALHKYTHLLVKRKRKKEDGPPKFASS